MDPSGPLKYMILGPLKFKKTKEKDGTTKVHESRLFIRPMKLLITGHKPWIKFDLFYTVIENIEYKGKLIRIYFET